MFNKLAKLFTIKDQFDDESQKLIDSFKLIAQEAEAISEMKKTEGWAVLDKKIKNELHERILLLVKDDQKINVLLALLNVASTDSTLQTLEEEIDKLLPQ